MQRPKSSTARFPARARRRAYTPARRAQRRNRAWDTAGASAFECTLGGCPPVATPSSAQRSVGGEQNQAGTCSLYRPARRAGAVANVARIGLRRDRRSKLDAGDRSGCKATRGAPDFPSAPPKATRQTGRYHAPVFRPDPRHTPRQPQDRATRRRTPDVDTDSDADPDAERNAREAATLEVGPGNTPNRLALNRRCARHRRHTRPRRVMRDPPTGTG